MTASFVIAFVVTPLLVLGLGWGAVFLHERSLRQDHRVPGE